MSPARFEVQSPTSMGEVLSLLSEQRPGTCLLAGGTDLMVGLRRGTRQAARLIDLKRVPELRALRCTARAGLWIGATVLLDEVARHRGVNRLYPAVAQAASVTANVQIRNMGTVVGNLCNASPCADNAPTLVALGAQARLLSLRGTRVVPLDAFFLGPGETVVEPDELVVAVQVPRPVPGLGAAYQCLSARGRVDMSAVSVGAALVLDGMRCVSARLVLGAVAPIPWRAREAEALLQEAVLTEERIAQAAERAAAEARPIDDIRASADYRRQMTAVLTRRVLVEAKRRAEGGRV